MSYLEICDRFDDIVKHLLVTNEETGMISKFFASYKKIVETFSSSLSKLSDSFKLPPQSTSSFSTLSLCLSMLKEHIQKLSDQQLQFTKSLQLDLIEPLDLFIEHFASTNSDLKNKGLYTYRELKTSQERMNKYKQEYYKASGEVEKATRASMIEDTKEKQEQAQRLGIHYMMLQEQHLDNYIQGILDVNKHWDEYDNIMPSVMESLQQNEESRIYFIKNTLEKYVRHYQKHQISVAGNFEKLGEIISNVNSAIDIRVFVDFYKSKNLVQREQFVSFDEWKQSLNETEYEVVDSEAAVISQVMASFLAGSKAEKTSGIESDNFSKLSELIAYPEGRRLFIEILQSKENQPFLTYQNLTQLAALLKELLSSMVRENESDAYLFSSVIAMSTVFVTMENNRKKTLASYISPHSVWIDPKRWLQAIHYNISSKAQIDKEVSQRAKKKSRFISFLNEIMKNTGPDRAEKASVYLILSQFSFHMVKLNVPTEIATSIIMTSTKEYKIDDEKVMLLISEIQARSNIELKVPEKKLIKTPDWLGIISASSKFFTITELCTASLVSKQWHLHFLQKKFKKVLLSRNFMQKFPESRKEIWKSLLSIHEVTMDYWETISKLDNSANLLGELSDVIEVDVARSFQKNPAISSRNLKNILKAYALHNEEIGYCQGMNYIAGTLFLVIQDEENSCKCLAAMIEKFSMSSLFTQNLKKLKKLFYIFDRLIVIYLPEINEVFKDAWVFTDHFSSAWFLTLFSSVLHTKFEVLVKVWDLFFLYGWKAIFRICIGVMQKYKESMIDKSFEDVLFILNGLATSNILDEDFFVHLESVKIPNRLIDEIEEEYVSIIVRSTYNY